MPTYEMHQMCIYWQYRVLLICSKRQILANYNKTEHIASVTGMIDTHGSLSFLRHLSRCTL